MPDLIYFNEDHIQLVKEVRANPELYELLLDVQPADVNEALGHIAAYLGIALDGLYSQQDLDELIEELVLMLRKKRSIIVSH